MNVPHVMELMPLPNIIKFLLNRVKQPVLMEDSKMSITVNIFAPFVKVHVQHAKLLMIRV